MDTHLKQVFGDIAANSIVNAIVRDAEVLYILADVVNQATGESAGSEMAAMAARIVNKRKAEDAAANAAAAKRAKAQTTARSSRQRDYTIPYAKEHGYDIPPQAMQELCRQYGRTAAGGVDIKESGNDAKEYSPCMLG